MPNSAQNNNNGDGYLGWSQSDREELGILRTRMSGVERDIRDLSSSMQTAISGVNTNIAALASKFEDRGRIPWQALSVMMAAVVTIGGLVYWPIRESQGRIVDQLDKIQSSSVTRSENDLRFSISAQRRDDLQRLTDSRVERIERDVGEMDKRIVPRGEHAEGWASQRARDADLQRQIEELRKGFGDLYSPKDALSRLLQRVDALERELMASARRPPG